MANFTSTCHHHVAAISNVAQPIKHTQRHFCLFLSIQIHFIRIKTNLTGQLVDVLGTLSRSDCDVTWNWIEQFQWQTPEEQTILSDVALLHDSTSMQCITIPEGLTTLTSNPSRFLLVVPNLSWQLRQYFASTWRRS